MARTVAAYCRKCKKPTDFHLNCGGWECCSCGSNNPLGGHDDSEFPYNIFRDY
ncbi:hypothetical protein Desaci_0861 [Desulfosporosinus acidiphilus SJ4]|uniref:Uncharacterized protein n=1 Tax=Desulfosporosinus acidiphilus (strain DSM 22704 / JCM 16185 / SJ4) TaxID=646529 RepID=I4D292_DESAJ|nr:hypothetical protein [Desulfosporosinus acidiphilus]AFM39916.1 hypothetical protein Desaci_0861 [Desulfosporosinus acidiphilus SJ4]